MKIKNINEVTLVGNLGADPEGRFDARGRLWLRASLATPRPGRDEPDWHRLVAFGKAAEALRAFRKGDRLRVTGRLRKRSWVAEDGDPVALWEVVVAEITAADGAGYENRAVLAGHLARPALPGVVRREDGTRTFVVDLVLATNRAWKRGDEWQEEVTYHLVRIPEPLDQEFRGLRKGAAVGVAGRVIYPGHGTSEAVVLATEARILSDLGEVEAPAESVPAIDDAAAEAAVGG